MKRNDYFILAFAGIVLAAIFITPADGAQITNAFARIFIDGVNVFNAKSYNDPLKFVSGSGISLSSSSPNTITITSTVSPGGDTNTAQIGDEGTHLSIYGSRFNATKNLLKTITCTGATCSANTTDILIAVSSSGGNATALNDLSDVAGVNNTKGNIFYANGGYWSGFKVGSNGQVLTADSTVAAGIKWSTVSSTLKVDNQTVNRKQFAVGLNNATGDWTMRTFALNNVTVTSKVWPVGINNQTGVVTTRTFALNNQTIQTGDYFVNGINNQTGVVTTKQFSVNTQSTTCSGSDKVSAVSINNATGAVTITCSTVTASDAQQSKRWGSFIPNSATALGHGILGTSAGLDGTETFEYNTTRGVLSIRSATGTTASANAGISQVTANFNLFRGDQNAYLRIEAAPAGNVQGTTTRTFIGFQSGVTILPNAADTIVNVLSAAGICKRTTDTVWQICTNDGAGTGTYATTGVTANTNWHVFEVYTTDSGVNWCVKIDGGTATCASTDIPATTTRLYFNAGTETTGAPSKNFNYGYVYVQNDK